MRVYVVYDHEHEPLAACTTLREARAVEDASSIAVIDMPINVDTVLRLLAGDPYATRIRHIDAPAAKTNGD